MRSGDGESESESGRDKLHDSSTDEEGDEEEGEGSLVVSAGEETVDKEGGQDAGPGGDVSESDTNGTGFADSDNNCKLA